MDKEFLEHVADFYGSLSVDDFANYVLGVHTSELMEYLEDLIDDNYSDICEEIGYTAEVEDEEQTED